MLENRENLAYEFPSKIFHGVRFVLFGYDSISIEQIRSKLCEGGGIDAVNYGPNCTHVIVDKLVYDDEICATARRDGKILVTSLWVDHSVDLGISVDTSSIMYRPLKDLNGIPGAESLIVCLTGYQRQDRDDIMTMVSLMGATFSKPLVAQKVTHLVCYKFEGQKYELAVKMKKIKLVNHHWLEDCLKKWEILPESGYCKSGYELELEAEAKDSEEETEEMSPIPTIRRRNVISPRNAGAENKSSHVSPVQQVSRSSLSLSASKSSAKICDISKVQSTPPKEINLEKPSTSKENSGWHFESPSSRTVKSPEKMPSEVLSCLFDGTVTCENVEDPLASASKTAKKSPISDTSKLSSTSFVRCSPRKASLPLSSVRTETNAGGPSPSNVDKYGISGKFNNPLETNQDGNDSNRIKTPLKETELQPDNGHIVASPNKRKRSVSQGTSIARLSHDSTTLEESTKKTEMLASGFPSDGSSGLAGHISPVTYTHHLGEQVVLAPEEASNIDVLSAGRQKDKEEAHQHSCEGLNKKTLSPNSARRGISSSRADNYTGEVEMHQSDRQGTKPPNSRTDISATEGSSGHADSKDGQTGRQLKPLKRKMLAKKTLGSRPTICKAGTAKHRGSVNLQKSMMLDEQLRASNGVVETEDTDNVTITEKVIKDPLTNADRRRKTQVNSLHISVQEAAEKHVPVDEETEAVDDKEENEFDDVSNIMKSAEAEAQLSGEKKKCTDGKFIGRKEKGAKSVDHKNMSEDKSSGGAGEEKLSKGKKRTLAKNKTNGLKNPVEEAKKDGSNIKEAKESTIAGNEETVPVAGRTKKRPSKKLKSSANAEKENKPVTVPQRSVSNNTGASAKLASQPSKRPLENGVEAEKPNENLMNVRQNRQEKTEPACFILSGHRLQRKEFQQVIKRLKGRVCRDSHHWSYQATHFIVPDPIRRTEKFFAAAASGSWILKTDYLAASSEAGKFLFEEPYEWHKKGLSEDGAINLEAPRKWRNLRERTGHGAFHGMRIIIYGECIAPPLDTLKRVVKAGDGTILATSPPYTRFLQSRIDFAIVSPGMPRVDMWVQEFLRHEIPCVVADYLVEYVCKPGYSLERHAQYNTHAWAEKSLKALVKRVEEVEVIEENARTPEDRGVDDVACQVCGSRDRGDEMLICGDESGSVGCGVGVHIDCLDPPLLDVPTEDWFCTSCSKRKDGKTIKKSSNKRASKSKK